MNNKELLKCIGYIDRKGYKLYLRSESIKKIFLSTKSDKSYTTFLSSKWNRSVGYSTYLSDMLDQRISYTEYLSEQNYIESYSNYQINNVTDIYSVVNYENL